MQARQAEINERVAVALEKLNGRMEHMEQWREDRDRDRERQEERTVERIEKAPDNRRADAALLLSACMTALYLISLIQQHWH